ncbi:MAG: hypothetical protein VYA68_02040 [Pseudomonadota bacterium]|nr:hypothetical protein [Pseudomonadota bacterium]
MITIACRKSFLDYFGLLTYMSLHVAFHHCLENGSLHVLQPALPGAAVKRHVFVTAGLNDLLTDPESAAEQRARFVDLRADLDAFIDGGNLTFCLAPFGARNERIARLAPVDKGLCEFRSRHPKPGIRVIGGFAARDSFIALGWHFRRDLGGCRLAGLARRLRRGAAQLGRAAGAPSTADL